MNYPLSKTFKFSPAQPIYLAVPQYHISIDLDPAGIRMFMPRGLNLFDPDGLLPRGVHFVIRIMNDSESDRMVNLFEPSINRMAPNFGNQSPITIIGGHPEYTYGLLLDHIEKSKIKLKCIMLESNDDGFKKMISERSYMTVFMHDDNGYQAMIPVRPNINTLNENSTVMNYHFSDGEQLNDKSGIRITIPGKTSVNVYVDGENTNKPVDLSPRNVFDRPIVERKYHRKKKRIKKQAKSSSRRKNSRNSRK
jgi:hypothetical protein